jgi:hypothetical protein
MLYWVHLAIAWMLYEYKSIHENRYGNKVLSMTKLDALRISKHVLFFKPLFWNRKENMWKTEIVGF